MRDFLGLRSRERKPGGGYDVLQIAPLGHPVPQCEVALPAVQRAELRGPASMMAGGYFSPSIEAIADAE
jgi:hypothetical protein